MAPRIDSERWPRQVAAAPTLCDEEKCAILGGNLLALLGIDVHAAAV